MAKILEDVIDKENEFDAAFGFPTEFPYEFETENIDEDFFAGLTRRLSHASLHQTRKQLSVSLLNNDKPEIQEKVRVMPGSPKSTLTRIGSWSGFTGGSSDGSSNGSTRVPSPMTIPFPAENDAWDVLNAAAGEVARLKMNEEASSFEFQNKRGVTGGLPPPIAAENRAATFFANPNHSYVQYQAQQMRQAQTHPQAQAHMQAQAHVQAHQKPTWWISRHVQVQNCVYDYEGLKCTRALPRSTYYSLSQVENQNNVLLNGSGSRTGLQNGSGVKRGTGVFLPRQYGAPLPQSRKKTSCAPVLVPAKVIHALNLNIDEFNSGRQPRLSNDLGVDYDSLLARRNVVLMQPQRLKMQQEAVSYEIDLPQEWTY